MAANWVAHLNPALDAAGLSVCCVFFCLSWNPVQLDPEFGVVYQGLRAMMRFMRDPDIAAEVKRKFYMEPVTPVDGPTARLRVLSETSVLGPLVYKLVDGEYSEDQWLHDLRQAWRSHLWKRVSRERHQNYTGAANIDRFKTMKWHNTLEHIADSAEESSTDEQVLNARAQLGVLRLLFAGGLMTPDRALRHKKQGEHMCRCGLEREFVEHVSWRCMQYQEYRFSLANELSCAIDDLPVCMKYAGIVPEGSMLTTQEVCAVQSFLVEVWQHHIKQWHSVGDLVVIPREVDDQQVLRGENVEENGHLLAPRANGPGMWCKRCGKFVALLKHVCLKIRRQACANPNGPLLAQEGHNMAESRLDRLERELKKYNKGGHVLKWNRQLGKQIGSQNEGWIQ